MLSLIALNKRAHWECRNNVEQLKQDVLHMCVCDVHFFCSPSVREDHRQVHESSAQGRQRQSTGGSARTPLQQIGGAVTKLTVHAATPRLAMMQKIGVAKTPYFRVACAPISRESEMQEPLRELLIPGGSGVNV